MHSIAKLGAKHVDYFAAKQGDPWTLTGDDRRSLARTAENLGLVVSNVVSNMVMILPGNIASGDKQELAECMDYVKACLDLSKEIGGRQVLLAAGERVVGLSHGKAWGNAAFALKRIPW